jgi:hypothetical protein
VTSALIGLIGVVLGGGIAAFLQLRSSARTVRGSARLLREELALTLSFVESVLKEGWQRNGRVCSDALWLERRSLLAMELGRQDWLSVQSAYQIVETIRAATPLADEPLSMDARDARPLLEDAAKKIRGGRDTLDSLSGSHPAITQYWRRRRYG